MAQKSYDETGFFDFLALSGDSLNGSQTRNQRHRRRRRYFSTYGAPRTTIIIIKIVVIITTDSGLRVIQVCNTSARYVINACASRITRLELDNYIVRTPRNRDETGQNPKRPIIIRALEPYTAPPAPSSSRALSCPPSARVYTCTARIIHAVCTRLAYNNARRYYCYNCDGYNNRIL